MLKGDLIQSKTSSKTSRGEKDSAKQDTIKDIIIDRRWTAISHTGGQRLALY